MSYRSQTLAKFSTANFALVNSTVPRGPRALSAMTILPADIRVFQRGWLSSNNVLCVSDETSALIDSGYGEHSTQTVALIEAELGERPLDLLLNTHLHSDHCGGNAAIQARYPAVHTHIPPGQRDAVLLWDELALTYQPTGQSCPRFGFDSVLTPGTTITLGDRSWQIHAASGHDPHSVILYEPDSSILISADALWETGFGVVFPEIEGDDAFDDVARSLDLIESLQPVLVIPGHGAPFTQVDGALLKARQRLAKFKADPLRHAIYAAKVLLKFRLLEVQSIERIELLRWIEQATYFSTLHQRYFPTIQFQAWIDLVTDELVKSEAAQVDGPLILNR